MMLMQCSGVNSENSNVVNFDTMSVSSKLRFQCVAVCHTPFRLGSIIILYQLLTTDAWDSYLW
jgi:hypothetical protein